MARALAVDPPIMLMDEPFGAVDPIVRDRLQNEFLRLQEELAKTILFVTHDIDEAIKIGDLVAVFQDGGKVAQFGTPAEILASPASEFVARFVGADRGLKRLALQRVGDLDLIQPAIGRSGDDAAAAREQARNAPFGYLLIVDDARRPVGWIAEEAIATSGSLDAAQANPVSPSVNKRTTLKDALSMMLDADVQAAIVVDRTGAVQGILTVETIIDMMRAGDHGQTFAIPPEDEAVPGEAVPSDGAERESVPAGAPEG